MNDDAEPLERADTSIEDLRVRVSGARVDSLLVGRVGGLAITVQSGGNAAPGSAAGTAAPSLPQAARPQVAARAPAPALAAAPRGEPTEMEGSSDLLSRTTTVAGDVIERTLDPSTGRVTERRIDRTGRLVGEKVVDVSQLTIVSQARDAHDRVVQVVQDTAGAFIQVLRDPVGRFLHAWVLRQ